jgi:iron complex outermembrane receptor protein
MSRTITSRARILLGVASVGLLSSLPVAAAAQSAVAQDKVDSPSATPADLATAVEAHDGGLEDIIVTAERRSQRLQSVPISATVLNAADLSRKGINNLADLQQVAPSLAINTFNRSTFINIRGVGIAQSAPTSNPGVAFYIDLSRTNSSSARASTISGRSKCCAGRRGR